MAARSPEDPKWVKEYIVGHDEKIASNIEKKMHAQAAAETAAQLHKDQAFAKQAEDQEAEALKALEEQQAKDEAAALGMQCDEDSAFAAALQENEKKAAEEWEAKHAAQLKADEEFARNLRSPDTVRREEQIAADARMAASTEADWNSGAVRSPVEGAGVGTPDPKHFMGAPRAHHFPDWVMKRAAEAGKGLDMEWVRSKAKEEGREVDDAYISDVAARNGMMVEFSWVVEEMAKEAFGTEAVVMDFAAQYVLKKAAQDGQGISMAWAQAKAKKEGMAVEVQAMARLAASEGRMADNEYIAATAYTHGKVIDVAWLSKMAAIEGVSVDGAWLQATMKEADAVPESQHQEMLEAKAEDQVPAALSTLLSPRGKDIERPVASQPADMVQCRPAGEVA